MLGIAGLVILTSGCAPFSTSKINEFSYIKLSESGGYYGGIDNYVAHITQNHIYVRDRLGQYESPAGYKIPPEKYAELWGTLEKNDIWNIPSVAVDHTVMDADNWVVVIEKGNRKRTIRVEGGYPSDIINEKFFNIVSAIKGFTNEFATEKSAETQKANKNF